jgi:hypothetical protein
LVIQQTGGASSQLNTGYVFIMITAVLKTVDNPEGFTINKKTLLNIFEEIQNVFIDELLYEYEDFISLDIKGSK